MKTFLSLLFVSFVLSCSQPTQKEQQIPKTDTATLSSPKQAQLLFPIEGTYLAVKDSNSSTFCEMQIKIQKHPAGYGFHLKTSKRDTIGSISLELNEQKTGYYMILNGIQWAEYDGDLANEDGEKELELPVGIQAALGHDELVIQNYGNSMNYYVQLGECGMKYIHLKKQ